jgi:hypothetical protein
MPPQPQYDPYAALRALPPPPTALPLPAQYDPQAALMGLPPPPTTTPRTTPPQYATLMSLPAVPTSLPALPHPYDAYSSQPAMSHQMAQLAALGPPPTHLHSRSMGYPSAPSYSMPAAPHHPPSGARRTDIGYDDLTAQMASLSIPSAPPASVSLSRGDIGNIYNQRLGIRSGSSRGDAFNAGYSLSANFQPRHLMQGMSSASQADWADDLRGSIRKMLDSSNADDRYLILATGVGSSPSAERYRAPGGLQTFPKGQVTGQAVASTSLRGKTEDQLVSWVMRQIQG